MSHIACATVITQLVGYMLDKVRSSQAVRELVGYGCITRMYLVRLLASSVDILES